MKFQVLLNHAGNPALGIVSGKPDWDPEGFDGFPIIVLDEGDEVEFI